MKLSLQIALGILIAGAISWSIRLALIDEALKDLNETTQKSIRQVAQIATVQAEEQRAKADAARIAQLRAKKDAAEATASAAAAETAKAEAKDAAWSAYYHPAKICDSPPDWNAQVEVWKRVHARKEILRAQTPGILLTRRRADNRGNGRRAPTGALVS